MLSKFLSKKFCKNISFVLVISIIFCMLTVVSFAEQSEVAYTGTGVNSYNGMSSSQFELNYNNGGTSAEKYGILNSRNTMSTSQFLVTITRPEGDESTFKRSYVICGNSKIKNIRVKLLMYNSDAGRYEEFENTDGDSAWDIGNSGVFMKEIELPARGANMIRIAAYNKYDSNLRLNENLQINNFTVTLLSRSIKQALRNGFFSITDMLNQLFD